MSGVVLVRLAAVVAAAVLWGGTAASAQAPGVDAASAHAALAALAAGSLRGASPEQSTATTLAALRAATPPGDLAAFDAALVPVSSALEAALGKADREEDAAFARSFTDGELRAILAMAESPDVRRIAFRAMEAAGSRGASGAIALTVAVGSLRAATAARAAQPAPVPAPGAPMPAQPTPKAAPPAPTTTAPPATKRDGASPPAPAPGQVGGGAAGAPGGGTAPPVPASNAREGDATGHAAPGAQR